MLITVEGVEGAGKSTGVAWIHQYLRAQSIDALLTREPGGTPIAESIRHIILNEHTEKLCATAELLLIFSARAQHIAQVIRPALSAQRWVLCDRFMDATYAYQGGGRGLPQERIHDLSNWVHGGVEPDITFLFDAPTDVCLNRLKKRPQKDRIEHEDKAFFERIRHTYLQRSQQYPQRFRVVDASADLKSVQQQLQGYLAPYLRG